MFGSLAPGTRTGLGSRSRITTSGFNSLAWITAASPSPASPQTSQENGSEERCAELRDQRVVVDEQYSQGHECVSSSN
jgi:hypothetical protein